MSKRNYKELWEQLKVIAICGGKIRWSNGAIFKTMTDLELFQLTQDPLRDVLKVTREVAKK